MAHDLRASLDWREIHVLRTIIGQPIRRLRYATVERPEAELGASREDALRVIERLAEKGLVRCHRDADDGCVCCASATPRGEAVAEMLLRRIDEARSPSTPAQDERRSFTQSSQSGAILGR